jgi:hypothetical protein
MLVSSCLCLGHLYEFGLALAKCLTGRTRAYTLHRYINSRSSPRSFHEGLHEKWEDLGPDRGEDQRDTVLDSSSRYPTGWTLESVTD